MPKEVEEIESRTVNEEESNNLQCEGMNIIIPSNIFDFCTRIEVLLGLSLSGHSDTITKASNLIDDIYRRKEIQTEQQYRNALDNFRTF